MHLAAAKAEDESSANFKEPACVVDILSEHLKGALSCAGARATKRMSEAQMRDMMMMMMMIAVGVRGIQWRLCVKRALLEKPYLN